MHRHLGIYAGTFDPVHAGHIAFALEAKRICRLDGVVFLPEVVSRNKKQVTDVEHRMAIVRHEIVSHPGLYAVRLKSEQFTIKDTLPELYSIFGPTGLTFLFGSDVISSLTKWEGINQLLQRHTLAIGMRANDNKSTIATTLEVMKAPIRYTMIRTAQNYASSSRLKKEACGLTRFSAKSQEYIRKYNLYTNFKSSGQDYANS